MADQVIHVGAHEHVERIVGLYEFFRYTFHGWIDGPVIVMNPEGLLIFDADEMQVFLLAHGELSMKQIWGAHCDPRKKTLTIDVALDLSSPGIPLDKIPDPVWEHLSVLCDQHPLLSARLLHLRSCADLLRLAVP